MQSRLFPRTSRALLLLVVAATAACRDLPSSPQALQMWAGERGWVAVETPRDLPDLGTWLAQLERDPAGAAVAARLHGLDRDARRARTQGDLARAAELRRQATGEAIGALRRSPQAKVFARGLGAVDDWITGVRHTVTVDGVPTLGEALDSVARDRSRTAAALAAGDSLAAARHLGRAADRIRDWSPEETALRVLDSVERRLLRQADSEVAADRARHLVQSARQELISGDPVRGLRRALYALQLAGGGQILEPEPEARPECGELDC